MLWPQTTHEMHLKMYMYLPFDPFVQKRVVFFAEMFLVL